jgi:hypothetical protein
VKIVVNMAQENTSDIPSEETEILKEKFDVIYECLRCEVQVNSL